MSRRFELMTHSRSVGGYKFPTTEAHDLAVQNNVQRITHLPDYDAEVMPEYISKYLSSVGWGAVCLHRQQYKQRIWGLYPIEKVE